MLTRPVSASGSADMLVLQVRKSRKDAERKKSRMSGDHKRGGGAGDAAGSSRATGSGTRFSKSTHGPPAVSRGGGSAGRGRGAASGRGVMLVVYLHVQLCTVGYDARQPLAFGCT